MEQKNEESKRGGKIIVKVGRDGEVRSRLRKEGRKDCKIDGEREWSGQYLKV